VLICGYYHPRLAQTADPEHFRAKTCQSAQKRQVVIPSAGHPDHNEIGLGAHDSGEGEAWPMRDMTRWCAVGILLLSKGQLPGADSRADLDLPDRAQLRPLSTFYSDLRVAVRARSALADDELLGPLNLGVRLKDGTAIVWGPIPSPDYADRVRVALLRVPGVFKVQSDLYVSLPLPEPEGMLLPDGKPAMQSAAAMPARGPVDLLPLAEVKNRASEGLFRPDGRVSGEPASLRRELAPQGTTVSLLPPIALKSPPEEVLPLASAKSVQDLLVQLQQRDGQYRGIRWEEHQGVVVLTGKSGDGTRLMAFAQQVRALVGVRRVIIQTRD
jgi:osmotically-inducible protein OsmY